MRQFGSDSRYHAELYGLLFGALLPIPIWLWQRKYPQSKLKYISIPVIVNGVSMLPPATGINYSSWFVVGFIFQYVIRRRHFGTFFLFFSWRAAAVILMRMCTAWWSKFNYVLSAALDSGTIISIFFIFFVLQLPKGITPPQWWGNLVHKNSEFGSAFLVAFTRLICALAAVDHWRTPLRTAPPEGLPIL